MWSPTHVQVLVKRAKGLNVKGKNGTNDAFVTIGLGKEKFQTSVKEKSEDPEWSEQCQLCIPQQGNRAEVVLKVMHRSFMGGDEFLGQISLPLQDFDVYEKPRASWYPMLCKPGQNKTDYRGELEVKLGFTVVASESVGGSVADLTKKNKGSLSSLNKVGGSLLSLGSREKKNFRKIAASVTSKVEKVGVKAKKSVSSLKLNKDRSGLESLPESSQWTNTVFDSHADGLHNEDPGVNSDDEDDMFQFDTLSHRSSLSSLGTNKLGTVSAVATPLQGSMDNLAIQSVKKEDENNKNPSGLQNEWEAKLLGQKKGLHVTSAYDDTISMSSITSGISSHLSSAASQVTTQDSWTPYTKEETKDHKESLSSLPSYHEAMGRESKNKEKPEDKEEKFSKKKIIPVQSDSSESSPSPEEPSTPVDSPQPLSLSSRFRSSNRNTRSQHIEEEKNMELGQKLKNSFSFRERQESKFGRKNSIESNSSRHSRTLSDTSQGPPHGTRVVLGRETSPIPCQSVSRIPKDFLDKFEGHTREDLIEMVVTLRAGVEDQGKKIADLEDYIDSLLLKIMESSPVLLEKHVLTCKPGK